MSNKELTITEQLELLAKRSDGATARALREIIDGTFDPVSVEEEVSQLLTADQLATVQKLIDGELLKRGIRTVTYLKIKDDRLELQSEPFQTVPVLFKQIRVRSVGSHLTQGSVSTSDGVQALREFFVSVHVTYDHFDGGGNGCHLFSLRGEFREHSCLPLRLSII